LPQLAEAPRVRSIVWELVGRACQRLPVAADADGTHQRPARCRPRHRTFRERAPSRLVVRRAAILMARVLSRWFQPGILAVGLGGCPCPAAKANPALTPFCRCPGRPWAPGRKSEHRNRERGRTNNEHARRNQVNRPEYEWPRYQADRSSVFSPPFADRRSPGHLGDCSAAERTNHRRRTTPEPAVTRRAQRVRQMDFLHPYPRQQQRGRTQPRHRSGAVDVRAPACRSLWFQIQNRDLRLKAVRLERSGPRECGLLAGRPGTRRSGRGRPSSGSIAPG